MIAVLAIVAIIVGVVVATLSKAAPTQPPTTPPTLPPTSATLPDLIELLSLVSPDGGTALATPLTPQNRAVNWLANNTNLDSYSDKRKIQRYTLGVLYYSTNGDSWRNNNGWLTDANECNWSNGADGLFCDENGAIFELDLYDGSGNNLVGTIPIELTLLSDSVASLALGDNSLMGTIPSEVGLLSKLTLLSIWGNTLTDTIPSQIALLSNLSWLDLGDNSLSGTIPSQLGLLTKLTELSLWDNSLTGTIPSELGLMSNLSYLDLSVNSLTGTIPSEVGLLTKLTGLFVYNNNFTGEFTCPDFIGDCWISCDHDYNCWISFDVETDTYTQACRSL
jgi:Leucine-rich repeat (LRR) protein